MTYVLSQKLVASGKTAGLDLLHWLLFVVVSLELSALIISWNYLVIRVVYISVQPFTMYPVYFYMRA